MGFWVAAIHKRGGTTHARPKGKRNPESPSSRYEAFQGRTSTKTLDLNGPANLPPNTWVLGELEEIRVVGREPLNFTKASAGRKFYLLGDARNPNNLWIAATRGNGTIAMANPAIGERKVKPIGKATYVTYRTLKLHVWPPDVDDTSYEHKFGEEGGERPTFAIDREGYPHIIGGDFEITPLGIRD
jgi:hypothetical protein